jgi:methionine synthase II (cobalamin-independent)
MSPVSALPLVHFVGSVPLATKEDVFIRLSKEFSGKLKRIPDGEVAERGNFTEWQLHCFPEEIRFGAYIPEYTEASDRYSLDSVDQLQPTRYDQVAISSYATFCELRNKGVIPSGVRFQVCLPTPANPVGFGVDRRYQPTAEKFYEQRLLQALKTIQEKIPAQDLAIQWDMPIEMAHMEHAYGQCGDFELFRPNYSPVKEGIVEKLKRLASAVAQDVQLGFHLCYGDFQHQHFVQPKDAGLLAELMNAISEGVSPIHSVDWYHIPVPKDRLDEGYFAPLTTLDTKGADLILGLVHPYDREGTRTRIETAGKVLGGRRFGVATECGLGRTPPEDLDSIIEIAGAVTE